MTSLILKKEGPVATITFNRPEVHNAMSLDMATRLAEACQEINQDKAILVTIITGSGDKAFCSGGDLGEYSNKVQEKGFLEAITPEYRFVQNAAREVAWLERPSIAAINGHALGLGLSIALACDLRIASPGARFGIPDALRGYMPLSGLTQWLPRLVGKGKALEMLFTAEPIDAREALRTGLINRLVEGKDVMREAEKLAKEIASKAPLSLSYLKEAVGRGLDLSLEQGMKLEMDLYALLQTTEDRQEGIQAFREKRQPKFRGL